MDKMVLFSCKEDQNAPSNLVPLFENTETYPLPHVSESLSHFSKKGLNYLILEFTLTVVRICSSEAAGKQIKNKGVGRAEN